MFVGKMSVSEVSCQRIIRDVSEMSVGKISVVEMSVGVLYGRQNVCRRNVLVQNILPLLQPYEQMHHADITFTCINSQAVRVFD